MNWWKRKPKDVIPNPRDKRKRAAAFEEVERGVLYTLQFFVFMVALLLLAAVS